MKCPRSLPRSLARGAAPRITLSLIRASESDSAYCVGKSAQDFFNSVNRLITARLRRRDARERDA
jgi:hypothetical protein